MFLTRLTWLTAYPFRCFFTLGSLWAVVAVAAWLLLLGGSSAPMISMIPMHWHAHEMIHGFASAMIAGFLLTAMSNWTGIPALSGRPLVALALLWIISRLVMVVSGPLPDTLVWMAPPLFYVALAAIATRDLVKSGNRRNLIMPVILLVLAGGSALMISGALYQQWSRVTLGTHLSLYTLTLLMVVIAGRITPAFTANWLRLRQRRSDDIRRYTAIERAGIVGLVLLAVADLSGLPAIIVSPLALATGLIHLVRLALWRGWRVGGEPLLWVLHLGYLALTLSIFARGAIVWTDYSPSLWYHLLGLGAIGVLVMGVMTRVALGHTGRPLVLPRLGLVAYVALLTALVARMASFAWPALGYQQLLFISGGAWVIGFFLFLWGYLPILSRPRPDGRPG